MKNFMNLLKRCVVFVVATGTMFLGVYAQQIRSTAGTDLALNSNHPIVDSNGNTWLDASRYLFAQQYRNTPNIYDGLKNQETAGATVGLIVTNEIPEDPDFDKIPNGSEVTPHEQAIIDAMEMKLKRYPEIMQALIATRGIILNDGSPKNLSGKILMAKRDGTSYVSFVLLEKQKCLEAFVPVLWTLVPVGVIVALVRHFGLFTVCCKLVGFCLPI